MTRLVADSGWSITGMPADCGSSAIASLHALLHQLARP